MSESGARWYAPVMHTLRGERMSRNRAASWGAFFAVMAVLSAVNAVLNAAVGDGSAPLIISQTWLSVWFGVVAWGFFAHAVIHAPRQTEGPEGGA